MYLGAGEKLIGIECLSVARLAIIEKTPRAKEDVFAETFRKSKTKAARPPPDSGRHRRAKCAVSERVKMTSEPLNCSNCYVLPFLPFVAIQRRGSDCHRNRWYGGEGEGRGSRERKSEQNFSAH